jgi:hypothetical protein
MRSLMMESRVGQKLWGISSKAYLGGYVSALAVTILAYVSPRKHGLTYWVFYVDLWGNKQALEKAHLSILQVYYFNNNFNKVPTSQIFFTVYIIYLTPLLLSLTVQSRMVQL